MKFCKLFVYYQKDENEQSVVFDDSYYACMFVYNLLKNNEVEFISFFIPQNCDECPMESECKDEH